MNNKKLIKIITHFVLLFLIGAIVGYVIEVSYYFIKHGVFLNKQGLWYGPFKPIYGLGLVLITAFLYKLKDKSFIYVFLIGTIIGTIFEYLAAVFQEVFLKTYTWTYASFNYNLNGKVYLPYCIVWGIFSIIWIKLGLKIYLKLFDKYYSNKLVIISLIILIFMLYNAFITYAILSRYSGRYYNLPAQNNFEKYIDANYPDEVVQKRFPKHRIIKSS